jgi:hypothetical protein
MFSASAEKTQAGSEPAYPNREEPMGAAQYIGCSGTVGAHRVGFMEHGHFGEAEDAMRARDELEQEVLRLCRQGYSTKYISNRMGISHNAAYRIKQQHGLVAKKDGHKTTKIKMIRNPESALDYVDDVRIMRGPDSEVGSRTYIVSVNDDKIVGITCGTVAGAINAVMRKVKEPDV